MTDAAPKPDRIREDLIRGITYIIMAIEEKDGFSRERENKSEQESE